MTRLFSKIICVVVGAVLGAAACGEDAVEYGMPQARYKIDGQVVAAVGSQPVQGIQIGLGGETVITDASGNFSLDVQTFPCNDQCQLEVKDIDGADNGGEFQDKNVAINPTKTAEGDGDWDEGTFEQSDIEVQLDEV